MTLVSVDDKATNSARSVNPTLRDIVYRALWRLNVYSVRETPADNEVNACIAEFNAMMQGWFLQDCIASYTEYGLNDTPSIDIGTTNSLYYDDCLIDNLSLRLIELYNLDPRSFRTAVIRANQSLDRVINLKRDKEFNNGTFRSNFDATLKNTPDIERSYAYIATGV